ncbi:rhomboid family intramembrane serine protease [Jannaschia seohaensis]|nr:rhomboid family intramembrane serine protease [Jannaschia seohaensis]
MSPPPPAEDVPQLDPRARALLWGAIALCVGIELVLQAADHGLIGDRRWRGLAYDYGAFWSQLLRGWRPNYAAQPWTMFASYAVLHGGLWHLTFNMVTLWSLGRAVAERAGAGGLASLLAGGTLGGAVGHGLLSAAPVPMVGASGALFGLAGALLVWAWADRRDARETQRPVIVAALVLVGINLVMWWALKGQLAWQAHLGGFVAGAALAPRRRG